MERKRGLNRIVVPVEPVYTAETLSDNNFAARAVVEPTGLFGLGRPIYWRSYDGNSQVDSRFRIKEITKEVHMWFAMGSDPKDAFVNGHCVEEVLVNKGEHPKVKKPTEFDTEA